MIKVKKFGDEENYIEVNTAMTRGEKLEYRKNSKNTLVINPDGKYTFRDYAIKEDPRQILLVKKTIKFVENGVEVQPTIDNFLSSYLDEVQEDAINAILEENNFLMKPAVVEKKEEEIKK